MWKTYLRQFCDWVLNPAHLRLARRLAVMAAVTGFFISLLIAWAYQHGWWDLRGVPPLVQSYYFAFYVAFSFILFYETLSLIFTIPRSIADSIGQQYQVMSLIILRGIFEHLGEYSHIHSLSGDAAEVLKLAVAAFGSLLIFFLVNVYYRLQPHRSVSHDPTQVSRFVSVKRLTATALIAVLLGLGIEEIGDIAQAIYHGTLDRVVVSHLFFSQVFSLLVFADVLLILLTMWYSAGYAIVFRTSALTISTVILRFSFGEDTYLSVLMALMAVLIGIGVTWVYQRFPEEASDMH